MRTVTSGFRTQMATPGKINDINVLYDTSEIKPESLKYSFAGNVFKTSLSSVEVAIKNSPQLLGKNITAKFGLLVGSAFEYINWENMYVYQSTFEPDKGITKHLSYDRMIKFMVPYNIASTADNLLDYLKDMCTAVGVELYSETFFNSDLPIGEDYFETQDVTFRDVLDQISEVTFCNILIKDGKLWLRDVKDMFLTAETLTNNMIKSGTVSDYFGGVNSLVLGRSPQTGDDIFEKDDADILANGLHEIRFDNNEFVDDIREDVILDMFNKIKTFGYTPTVTKTKGLGYLEFGDCLLIPNVEDTVLYTSLITSYEFTVTTGTADTITSIAPTTSTTEYKYTTPEMKKINNAEIKVDKNTASIEILTSTKVGNNEIISKINLTPEEIKIQASKIALEGYVSINNSFQIDEQGNLIIGEYVNAGKYNMLEDSAGLLGMTDWTKSSPWTLIT